MYIIKRKNYSGREVPIASGETLADVVDHYLSNLNNIEYFPYDEQGNWDGADALEVFEKNRDRYYEFLYEDDEKIL